MNDNMGCLVALPFYILGAFVNMARELRGGSYCPNCNKRCAHRTSVKGEWWECLDCGYREASVSRFDDAPWEVQKGD